MYVTEGLSQCYFDFETKNQISYTKIEKNIGILIIFYPSYPVYWINNYN